MQMTSRQTSKLRIRVGSKQQDKILNSPPLEYPCYGQGNEGYHQLRVDCNILKEIQARSWVGFGKSRRTVVVTKCLQEVRSRIP
ncbi:hypothetical protein PIB30_064561 [Stylosanthes scabra]|uniref:Uncharacterized protein n=1 Tax=Stylosanthes scabra TaxID=79078 RepID=A0ABU6QMV9_9FABA|nr:hypothetical protein [Stylosanthes scabra]